MVPKRRWEDYFLVSFTCVISNGAPSCGLHNSQCAHCLNTFSSSLICLFMPPLGINAQARKLQKSRSRVTSTLVKRTMGRSQKLWRSKSEMDLLDGEAESDTEHDAHTKDLPESLSHSSVHNHESPKTSPEQIGIHSVVAPSEGDGRSGSKTEALCLSRQRGEREGEESEREETESSDDNTTQYSIHPPHDCPYLLLLQGWSLTQVHVQSQFCHNVVWGVVRIILIGTAD
ncbi:hypothetical protein XENOCAPTIV_021083 [Xenoophorus captivus]|uniref:Uncharacterized protein n=1 Tax=Xenoophorus captivus TaxID=1517983 RepID=A0ABV0QU54_9TELE